jgi:hypothetical protein
MKTRVVLGLALLVLSPTAFAEVGERPATFEAIEESLIRGYYATAREATKLEIKRLTVQGRRKAENDAAESGDPTYDESLGKGAAKIKQQAMKKRGSGFVEGIPPDHMPPPGLCRAWLPDTQPGRQPPPADCARVMDGLPAGATVLYGGPKGEKDALPRSLGDFLPADLLEALGLPWPEADLLLVGDDVYLVDQSDRTILDILESVLLPQ